MQPSERKVQRLSDTRRIASSSVGRLLLHILKGVRVDTKGKGRITVSQSLTDHLWVHPLFKQMSGV